MNFNKFKCNRPSPGQSAQSLPGQVCIGNDETHLYVSRPDKNGVHKWQKLCEILGILSEPTGELSEFGLPCHVYFVDTVRGKWKLMEKGVVILENQ